MVPPCHGGEGVTCTFVNLLCLQLCVHENQEVNSEVVPISSRISAKIRTSIACDFSLSSVSGIEQFVVREEELAEIHRALRGDGSRRTVVLRSLGGIGKPSLQLHM